MKQRKALLILLTIATCLLTACTDYCSYGGCMREAEYDGRCSEHKGLENNPYYGVPPEWYVE